MPPSEKKQSPSIVATENVIIFDWDDTLLASSYLASKGYRLDSNDRVIEVDSQLKELEQAVCSVLSLAVSYGRTHIITNAETGWVQLSAQKFIPGVLPLLNKVVVHSARSTYESMFPQEPLKWKYYAFQEKLTTTFADNKSEKNVVSFGDSHVEREAVRAVTKGFTNTRTKSVKFAERPSMEQLRRQLDLVVNCFKYILTHDGDLDLQLTISNNQQQTQQTQQQQKEIHEKTQQSQQSSQQTQQQQQQQQQQKEVHQKEKEDKKEVIQSTASSSTTTKAMSSQSNCSTSSNNLQSSHTNSHSQKGPLWVPSPMQTTRA